MKRQLLLIFSALLLFTFQAKAQCTGGPDPACAGTNGPCGTFNDGTVGTPYNDTMTFYAPNQVDAGSPFGMVDFVQFQLANVTGLPPGLTWNCGNGSCVYDPQPSGILTSFHVCGTPIVPGTYTLHVHIIGTVYIPGIGNQSGDQYYDLPLVINTLGGGGNSVFAFTPSQGCDSASVSFTPSMNFPLPQITGYYWDFGGGNVSSVTTTTPIVIDYNTTGVYPVTCTTSVYNLVLDNLNLNVIGTGWWCGDIEELNCPNNNPDLVPVFTTGGSNWTGPEVSDNATPSWSLINYVLTTNTYSIWMTDIDAVSANDNPAAPFSGAITGIGVYNFNSPGNFSGSFEIIAQLASQFIATDTVFIYASPPMDTIDATALSFCPYDSSILSVYPGFYYEWYLNDTVQVQAGTNNTYTTNVAGSYHVVIIDPISGCYVTTDPINLTLLPIVPPGFPNVGITETPPGTYHSILPGGYTYLWLYFDGINYFPIPSETTSDITPTINGVYCLVATNSAGCLDTSNCIGFHLGLDNSTTPFMANVFPNPSNGNINLTVANLTQDATLNVYDMIGQQVFSVQVLGNGGSIQEMYDLSFLKQGMYILELRNQQSRYTQKLIIE